MFCERWKRCKAVLPLISTHIELLWWPQLAIRLNLESKSCQDATVHATVTVHTSKRAAAVL